MRRSSQWRDGHFHDVIPRPGSSAYVYLRRQIGWGAMSDWLMGGSKYRVPTEAAPFDARVKADFDANPESGLRLTWVGHSTTIVEIDGARVLIDPVWSKYAGPTAVAGQRRFFAPPLALEELPEIDVVVISHDHYDHLDYPTIIELARTDARFVTALGVGAHLERWGIAAERIFELDWWESQQLAGLTFTATPARHFSGRGVLDLESTLWAGFAIAGSKHRVYFTGDTAMFPGLREIGERLGPFDATLIDSGGYNRHWADVHLGPEQAVQAHRMLRGKLMVPVHWGMFNLAMHGWTEPIERVLVAAAAHGVRVATPRLGESYEPGVRVPAERWWPELPWDTAADAPIQSTELAGIAAAEGAEGQA